MNTKIILTIIFVFFAQFSFAENIMVCQKEALAEGTPIGAAIDDDGSVHGNAEAYNSQLKWNDNDNLLFL